ncbi:hypothetical protein FNV43_RR09061 [Rhamnella rubrinervis]|uniref:Uncharacterized protein n=1 Tax=Rhamnella rubrinervis TaxID=2594499 RepID=A0A8K0HAK9_9ROSA|nr:hypothetical protein FNV43_RR09061 [Rhamnella rubrinervis]
MAIHHPFASSIPDCITTSNRKQPFISSSAPLSSLAWISETTLRSVRVMDSTRNSEGNNNTITRRSANYQPPVWQFDFVQSLKSDFVGEAYVKRAEKLKEEVRMMLEKLEDPLAQLEHVDVLQRLGLSYHFEDQVESILNSIYTKNFLDGAKGKNNLYYTALAFRLLRQHGNSVPQEIFNDFKDEDGNLKASMCEDTMGMLCLYEASYHCIDADSILIEARHLATKHLQAYMDRQKQVQDQSSDLCTLVNHALELPLHWRVPRLETRWFIDSYESRRDYNLILLDFAKLDFNMVQQLHQEDLKDVSGWWRNSCLGEKLWFARDRLMENFLWTVGVSFEPKYDYARKMATKVNALITVIDDIYDVYGTLDELELFTNAVERWDVHAMENLPDYMKICFLALHNSINEMAYDVLKDQGLDIIKYLKKSWIDLCKCYLREAKWYHSGYVPTFEEYIENAWISISGPVILFHAFFVSTNPISKEALQCMEEYPNLIRWSSMILRLADDLGTSSDEMKRGDIPKSIQCYMHQTGASEDDAREYVKHMISETWKRLNEEGLTANSNFSKSFIRTTMNLARMAQCMYEHGDGHTTQCQETINHVFSLLIRPIPLI